MNGGKLLRESSPLHIKGHTVNTLKKRGEYAQRQECVASGRTSTRALCHSIFSVCVYAKMEVLVLGATLFSNKLPIHYSEFARAATQYATLWCILHELLCWWKTDNVRPVVHKHINACAMSLRVWMASRSTRTRMGTWIFHFTNTTKLGLHSHSQTKSSLKKWKNCTSG